jgi:hypothetical protein
VMSPSARGSHWTRGRFSDLESLKSGKDRTKLRILFAFCTRTNETRRIFTAN